ncbi:PKD domain-containing protein [Xanthovirga aplysinae]|uniref:PKD domain-containing protein n=1 Tax=Xanthovirga aplysinae TaxID=2529853 RepID=UPI0012BB70C2|nr:PKD domain-containing protein [Xanthovirga aplysinae]MTI32075.1 PKD domain-containing protein [Xanthovirga aplysinae]
MKNKNATKWISLLFTGSLLLMLTFSACEEDPEPPADQKVTVAFSYTAEGNTITFLNASANATTFEWDFGDGETSTDEAPVHEYDEPGAYQVTLKASNATYSDEQKQEVLTANAGAIASFIVGKTWIAAREENFAIGLGPLDNGEVKAGEDWTEENPYWFAWGDKDERRPGDSQLLIQRPSAANDEYTFNADGTYDVDFNGDFWGEYGVWADVEGADQVDIIIENGSLPLNTNGENVDAFVAGTWDWIVDEEAMTLQVKGPGAHILNPRLKNDIFSFDVGDGITYKVDKMVPGENVDILVTYIDTNDGANDIREYHVLASYHGAVTEMKPLPEPEPERDRDPNDESSYAETTSSADISHSFLAEDGQGSGIWSVDGTYELTFGVEVGGETATQFNRVEGDGTSGYVYANYLMRANGEIDFSAGTTVKVDVYFPSTNVYEGALTQKVIIRFMDESRNGNYWETYVALESEELTLDEWHSLEFDFAAAIEAEAAAGHSLDGVMIEFGGSDHLVEGTFYAKNFRIE